MDRFMMFFVGCRSLFVASIFTVLAACSPTASKLESFGKASESAVSLVGLPEKTSKSALTDATINQSFCGYLATGTVGQLGRSSDHSTSKLMQDQAKVGKALEAYSKALAGAFDVEAETKLREAGVELAAEAGELVVATGGSSEVSASIGAIADVILRINANRRIKDIKAEMESVLPYLIQLEILLREDAVKIDAELARHIATWENSAVCTLDGLNRADPETRDLFVVFDARKRQLEKDRKTAANAANAVKALQNAHVEVIADDGSLDDGIEILEVFVSKIKAIEDA